MAASVLLGVVVSVFGITPWDSFSDGLLLGIVVAIFAPLGDLCESMLKRDLGLKDFGTMLPGHGGVLDRFDAMLFCLPAVYYLVLALGIGS
jgi:phosphatidate cytidylyltransferase